MKYMTRFAKSVIDNLPSNYKKTPINDLQLEEEVREQSLEKILDKKKMTPAAHELSSIRKIYNSLRFNHKMPYEIAAATAVKTFLISIERAQGENWTAINGKRHKPLGYTIRKLQ